MSTKLATAKPNVEYRWFRNFSKVSIEARLESNGVYFYEIYNDGEHCYDREISQDLVKSLFPIGCRKKDQPYTIHSNVDFYAILNRHRVKFRSRFKEIVKELTRPKFIRTSSPSKFVHPLSQFKFVRTSTSSQTKLKRGR
jgi:hypothetical protein